MKCPCGCGRKVPFLGGNAARQYVNVTEMLSGLPEFEAELRTDGADTSCLKPLYQRGERLQRLLVDYAHGDAHPGTHPDLLAVARDLQVWNADLERAMAGIVMSAAKAQGYSDA